MTGIEFFFWSSVEAAPTINGALLYGVRLIRSDAQIHQSQARGERGIDSRFAPLEHRLIYPH
jgi:hypothetical protein